MDRVNSNNKKMPLVSVIISVFNEEKYIRESINSIINQTYNNLEIIIIDDYCTDKSISILNEFTDTRIILYHKINEPRFLAASRNIGINLANGEYILLHDADDTCTTDRVEKQLNKAMELNCDAIIGCFVNKIYPDGAVLKMVLPEKHEAIIMGFKRFRNRATIVSGTILGSKSIFERFNYNENLKYMQDWDHMLRMYESGAIQFYNIPEFLYNYFQKTKNVVSKPDWPDYNILIRINQKRRQAGKTEISGLSELENHLKSKPHKRLFWHTVKYMINLNTKIKRSSKT